MTSVRSRRGITGKALAKALSQHARVVTWVTLTMAVYVTIGSLFLGNWTAAAGWGVAAAFTFVSVLPEPEPAPDPAVQERPGVSGGGE